MNRYQAHYIDRHRAYLVDVARWTMFVLGMGMLVIGFAVYVATHR